MRARNTSAAFSGYWAAGGRWMLASVGSFATEWVDSDPTAARTALLVLTVVKLAAAILPLLTSHGTIGMRRPIYAVSWVGSILLIVWGGASFVGAVIGLIASPDNREVKLGHLLFDGIFLLWGAALLIGLVQTRRFRSRRAEPESTR